MGLLSRPIGGEPFARPWILDCQYIVLGAGRSSFANGGAAGLGDGQVGLLVDIVSKHGV